MRRWWPVGLAALVVVAAGYGYWRARTGRAEAPRWRTAVVQRGELRVAVTASGTVQPASQVEVKSRATGVVRAVYAREGDAVRAGQVLVLIEDPDAQSAVRDAEAQLAAAQARLAQAQAQRASLRAQAGAEVRQAQAALAAARARLDKLRQGARPEEVAQAEQAVRAAEAELTLRRQDLTRATQLYGQGFVPRQQVDQAQASLAAAEAAYRSALERLEQLQAGPTAAELQEAQAAVRQAEAQVQQARARLLEDWVRQQEVAAAQAAVDQARVRLRNARDRLAESRIRAPVSGIVARRSVEVGQSVIGTAQGGTPVMSLAVTEPLYARVLVDEVDIARIRVGTPAVVRADALPEAAFPGQVEAVAASAQVNTNVVQYEVSVRVEDPRRLLKLGMTVEAEFQLLRRSGVLLVPREAVRGERSRLVLVVQGGRLLPRPVTVGDTDGRMVEIRAGLREGEVVYLGEERGAAPAGQPRNPFLPQFPRRPPSPGRP
ncbi:MAG: efflux RND transporter periplasmic adaptor subunit [Armatimonadota bacterium]|nr:efflux RND transporter periplasmic adaptor subunit [Armatimonadota bacterium]